MANWRLSWLTIAADDVARSVPLARRAANGAKVAKVRCSRGSDDVARGRHLKENRGGGGGKYARGVGAAVLCFGLCRARRGAGKSAFGLRGDGGLWPVAAPLRVELARGAA
jgi:hypothetical protein